MSFPGGQRSGSKSAGLEMATFRIGFWAKIKSLRVGVKGKGVQRTKQGTIGLILVCLFESPRTLRI